MEPEFAQELCALNNRFYSTWAHSFSSTRHNIWPGWIRCLEETGLLANSIEGSKIAMAAKGSQDDLKTQRSTDTNTSPNSIPVSPRKPLATPCAHTVNTDSKQLERLEVIDVACGNLRFEGFLARTFPHKQIKVLALDSCDELALLGKGNVNTDIEFRHCDAMKALQDGNLCSFISTPHETEEINNGTGRAKTAQHTKVQKASHLTVSFGFMHHIPLPEWRAKFINALIQATKPGGFICVSLWKFMNSPSMAAKAAETHFKGITELGYCPESFNNGDYLLGWKNEPGAYRYCHSFSTEEINELIDGTSATTTLKARFQADGRTGNLNEYLVLQKN